MYFDHAPKHMIRLSVDYRQDSKIPIRLWKSLVGDTPSFFMVLALVVVNYNNPASNFYFAGFSWCVTSL